MDIGKIYLLIAFILLILSAVKSPEKTKQALKATGRISLTVFPVLFLIFILMGVTSVFLSKEMISSWLGSGSGVSGIVIGELVGSFALVQPAAVFPYAGILHKMGAGYSSLLGFVMAAILIGVTTLPLEIKCLGKKFAIVRNILTFILIFIMALISKFVL